MSQDIKKNTSTSTAKLTLYIHQIGTKSEKYPYCSGRLNTEYCVVIRVPVND